MDERQSTKRKRDEDNVLSQRPWAGRHRNRGEKQRDRGPGNSWHRTDQARLNQLQEEERHREFLAQEGEFVLRQKRKAAEIRVIEGRSRPIDWLAVILRVIDPQEDLINNEYEEKDVEYVDPETVFDGLSESQLLELKKDIEDFIDIERKARNRDYWRTMRTICKDRLTKLKARGPEGRAVSSVAADIDRLLGPKSYEELERLERQIKDKLDSDEPIDTDYWQQLLEHLMVHKAKAKLKQVYVTVLDSRLAALQRQNSEAASVARSALSDGQISAPSYSKAVDPDPLLQVDAKDRASGIIDKAEFLGKVTTDRQRIIKMRYVPLPKDSQQRQGAGNTLSSQHISAQSNGRFDHGPEGSESQAASALFDREAAKGVEEDEEIFAGEEEVETKNKDDWMGKYRPRKPKYFNRVQMGYEWNKYNQTHYDHENPPPKVVQGYKFHIFYPELIDKTRAPTYVITREGGRKKGETLAPAGEEDTCIIRFMSGPPYEDIAFRIVDRDWDYSAKHDRGFKNTFERGVLTLHFSFKKTYYRK